MRAFIAIAMPPAVTDRLASCVQLLRPRMPEVRWIDAASLHLTLRFLGEHDASVHEACGRQAADGLGALERPAITLARLGSFPERGPARIVWAGLEDEGGRLGRAAAICEAAAVATGYPREDRPFHPHVTLARISDRRPRGGARVDVSALPEVSGHLTAPPLPRLEAAEAILFESRLSRGGAEYRPVARYPFASREQAAC